MMHSLTSFLRHHRKNVIVITFAFLFCLFLWTGMLSDSLHAAYRSEVSERINDRNGATLMLMPNARGAYMTEATSSNRLRELVVRSEDRFFFYHPGINPVSTLRAFFRYLFWGEHKGGSTITQQLSKNLLHHENQRTFTNKLVELAFALSLELHTGKQELLSMYLNSAYFGNQREGVYEASRYYFGKDPSRLSDGDIARLLALLSAPAYAPGSEANTVRATAIASRIGVSSIGDYRAPPTEIRENKNDPAMFELGDLARCTSSCTLTADRELTARIREIVRDNLASPQFASVSNAAVAVIRVGKNSAPDQLLALVGTPDPYGSSNGHQINMALQPRPIGSTWKPFIYGKAIEAGARPYTMINDAEYRYDIGTGYAFYPKNYDGIYRGPVTLNYALSNSLNVPAVRALQFDDIDHFGAFMQNELGFISRQDLDTYQLSIALGGLEMNPLALAKYFSVFPREGQLAPLEVVAGSAADIPMMKPILAPVHVFRATTTRIMNRMLSDRLMGVEQFGLESNLNLPFQDYAVKTGTSYDYHDSWTVGYTPDVVVVAWIGNSNNKAMDLLTGSRGAGKIWHDVMTLLLADSYITPQHFSTDGLVDVTTKEGNSFGLLGDDVSYARTIMEHDDFVLEPHDGDVLEWEAGMTVPLRGSVPLSWEIDGTPLGRGTEIVWKPRGAGEYSLSAHVDGSPKPIILRIRIVE